MTDLTAAAQALSAAQNVVDSGIARLAEIGIDDNQVLAYDVAHGAAAVQTGQSLLNSYGDKGEIEAKMADPATYQDGERAAALQREYAEVKSALESTFARWEEAQVAYEALLEGLEKDN